MPKAKEKTTKKSATNTPSRYLEAVGRRKEAIARVRITVGGTGVVVNDKPVETYFSLPRLQQTINEPFAKTDTKAAVSVKVSGGGQSAQAEAIRLGIARALVEHDADLRPVLKQAGFLTRDARVVERKKFGLRKARRAPQWSKR